MQKQCPYCPAIVKDLKSHIRRKHPEKLEQNENNPQSNNDQGNENENLELDTSQANTGNDNQGISSSNKYHCVDCGGVVTYRQNPCPHCGSELNWSGIQ